MQYVERWLNFVAKNYEYFKDFAEKLDFMSMESAYTGSTFEGDSLLEKKGPIEPSLVEEYENAFK